MKNNHGSGDLKGNYASKTEFIFYCMKGRKLLNNGRHHNVLEYKKTLNNLHPTEKPVDMFEFLIAKSSNERDLILDVFAGSGTTGIACMNTNRQFILMEKEEKYYNTILKRIEDHKLELCKKKD